MAAGAGAEEVRGGDELSGADAVANEAVEAAFDAVFADGFAEEGDLFALSRVERLFGGPVLQTGHVDESGADAIS